MRLVYETYDRVLYFQIQTYLFGVFDKGMVLGYAGVTSFCTFEL